MRQDELKRGRLVQKGRELFSVSELYKGHWTAQVLYPLPGRTAVRSIPYKDVGKFHPPTRAILAKYENAWGFAPGSSLKLEDAFWGKKPNNAPKRKPGGLQAIVGKWPGDESDEVIADALKQMS